MSSEYERLKFRYSLGEPIAITTKGNKLNNPNIVVRQINILPSTKGAKKYWLVVGVSHVEDLHLVGEIMIDVKPDSAIHHEAFVTVESGMRSGQIGSERVLQRSRLEQAHITALSTVRSRLLQDWIALLKNPSPSNDLLLEVASDLDNARLSLRVDARNRTRSTVRFADSLGRPNPRANAARLTAAIARLRLQIEADVLNKYSLHYRFLNCTVIAENIAADICDMQVMAYRDTRDYGSSILQRLNRIAIKPYFWAAIWIRNNIGDNPRDMALHAPFIAQLLATEQRLGEIDMLLSEFKRSNYEEKKVLLKLITLSISTFPRTSMPLSYLQLFETLQKKCRRLAIAKSKTEEQYKITANAMQAVIRYRASTDPNDCWYISGSHRLIAKI